MDPLTQALAVANSALQFGMKIWDATPPALQAQSAGDWAKFVHNISAVFLDIQDQISSAVKQGGAK